MSKRTEARVVSVIDAYRCAINWGSRDKVQLGDRFIVYGLGERVNDPETGEDLGVLEIVRGKAKATHIQPRLTTLETYEQEVLPGKRIIRHGPYTSILGEQVEEQGQTRQATLDDVATGDYARPI